MADRGVRRYGFHGLSYEYIAGVLAEHDAGAAGGKAVVLHLGNGASMCTIADGRSIATTMGFTAADGLPMGTRCGSLDPGVMLYLMDELRMDARAIEQLFYQQSALLGVSGPNTCSSGQAPAFTKFLRGSAKKMGRARPIRSAPRRFRVCLPARAATPLAATTDSHISVCSTFHCVRGRPLAAPPIEPFEATGFVAIAARHLRLCTGAGKDPANGGTVRCRRQRLLSRYFSCDAGTLGRGRAS